MSPAALWLFSRIPIQAQGGIVEVSVQSQELDFDIPGEELRNSFQLRVLSDFVIFLGFKDPWFAGSSCFPSGKHPLCLTGGGIQTRAKKLYLRKISGGSSGTNPSPKCRSGVTSITCVAVSLRWRSLGVLISSGSFIYP